MKTRNKIILIVIIMPVLFYASVVTYATTPFEVFNPHTLSVFPSIVKQLVANEGNGKVCYDGCGPCSAWGYNYLLVDGECKIPDKVEDCYYIDPPMEWEFVDDECIPAKKYRKEIRENLWLINTPAVKDCVPKTPGQAVPDIGYENRTHYFDVRICEWFDRK